MAAVDPVRDTKQLKRMAEYFIEKKQPRNYLLLIVGVYTALRVGDLLALTWNDVYDFENRRFREHLQLNERKTGKPKVVALNSRIISALRMCFALSERKAKDFLFLNNRKSNPAPISRSRAYRIIRAAAEAAGVDGRVSCHSLRKTFGYHAWRDGVPPALLMDIYNHSSFETTKRYLGIVQDDRDKVYRKMNLAV